jgi:hypothetical protein
MVEVDSSLVRVHACLDGQVSFKLPIFQPGGISCSLDRSNTRDVVKSCVPDDFFAFTNEADPAMTVYWLIYWQVGPQHLQSKTSPSTKSRDERANVDSAVETDTQVKTSCLQNVCGELQVESHAVPLH